jgi:hypothetical protein
MKHVWAAILFTFAAHGATVEGIVIDASSGSGVPDICSSLAQQSRLVYSTTTDAQGHFRIDNVPDGVYAAENSQRCDAIHPDWSLPGGPAFSVKADATPAYLEFKLEMLG